MGYHKRIISFNWQRIDVAYVYACTMYRSVVVYVMTSCKYFVNT